MKDAMGRRARYSRSYKKPNITLSDRDIEILTVLARYRYIRKDFLHALLPPQSMQVLTRRLRDLFDAGYVNRPEEQWRAFNARYSQAVYEIDVLGEEALRERGVYPRELSSLTRKSRGGAIRQYPHSMMICDTLASIEIGLKGTGHRLITWSEILERRGTISKENPFKLPCTIDYVYQTGAEYHAETSVVPDALFGIRHPDGMASFFVLEAERGNGIERRNLDQPSFLKKLLAYRNISHTKVYKEVLGIPNMRVLVVTPGEQRIKHMRELAEREIGQSRLFLFQSIPTQDANLKAPSPFPILSTIPWERAGLDATSLLD